MADMYWIRTDRESKHPARLLWHFQLSSLLRLLLRTVFIAVCLWLFSVVLPFRFFFPLTLCSSLLCLCWVRIGFMRGILAELRGTLFMTVALRTLHFASVRFIVSTFVLHVYYVVFFPLSLSVRAPSTPQLYRIGFSCNLSSFLFRFLVCLLSCALCVSSAFVILLCSLPVCRSHLNRLCSLTRYMCLPSWPFRICR